MVSATTASCAVALLLAIVAHPCLAIPDLPAAQEETRPPVAKGVLLKEGAPFPHFVATDIDGKAIDTRASSGRLLLVLLSAEHCPSCTDQLSEMIELFHMYNSRGLDVLDIWVGGRHPEKLRQYVDKQGLVLPFPAVIDTEDTIRSHLGVTALPTAILVDPAGTVRLVHVGWVKKSGGRVPKPTGRPGDWEAVEKAVSACPPVGRPAAVHGTEELIRESAADGAKKLVSTQYQFTIEYPSDLRAAELPHRSDLAHFYISRNQGDFEVGIHVREKDADWDSPESFRRQVQQWMGLSEKNINVLKTFVIGGYPAVREDYFYGSEDPGAVNPAVRVYTFNESYMFRIGCCCGKEKCDRIIETFSFTGEHERD